MCALVLETVPADKSAGTNECNDGGFLELKGGGGLNIGRVVGTVVCTVKTPTLSGIKLMVVRQIVNGVEKGLVIACDGTRQAGIGDTVFMIGRAEAALMISRDAPPPSDLTIAGIIDPETL